jgi:hypothetical protein
MSCRYFHGFSFQLPIFGKNRPISNKIHPNIDTPIFWEIADLSVKSAD